MDVKEAAPRMLDPANEKDTEIIEKVQHIVASVGVAMAFYGASRAEGMTALAVFVAEETPDEMIEDVLRMFCHSVRLNKAGMEMPENKGELN